MHAGHTLTSAIKMKVLMIHKMIVAATIAGLLGGYAAMLYVLVYLAVLIDRSYLLSLAM